MLTREHEISNLQLQAQEHPVVPSENFRTIEQYVLFLTHLKAYELGTHIGGGKKVIDWGCNDGYGTRLLAQTARALVAVDVSPALVALAQSRLASLPVPVLLFDGQNCPAASNQFDIVLSFQVLEHVLGYERFFGPIKESLRSPAGVLVISTPNATHRVEPGGKPWNRFHVHEFRPEELRSLLSGWFRHVELRGLVGSSTLMSIERRRIQWHRNMDDRQDAVERRGRSVRSDHGTEADIPQNLTTEDLWYRATCLEEAIDIMAYCSDDKCALQSILTRADEFTR